MKLRNIFSALLSVFLGGRIFVPGLARNTSRHAVTKMRLELRFGGMPSINRDVCRKFYRCFIVLCAISALTSCKLRIVVPEGGSVTTSSGAYHCAAGEKCDIDVVDFYFDETFAAVPADGYAFKAWRKKGDRRFCGNDPKPCHILTTGFTGDWVPAIQQFLDASDEVFYLQPIFVPAGDIIPVNGKEWLQPDLFIGLTWEEIDAVCPNGVCNGVLAGRDVTGWTWASIEDVAALFNYYIGRPVFVGDVDGFPGFEEADSAWAPAFFNTGWRPISDGPGPVEGVHGMTRSIAYTDQNDATVIYAAGITNLPTGFVGEGGIGDYVLARSLGYTTTLFPSPTGAWFFRERNKDGRPARCSQYVSDTLFCDTVNEPICTVTVAQISQIAVGMSYDQVVGILGCHGRLSIWGGDASSGAALYYWGGADHNGIMFTYGPTFGYSVPTMLQIGAPL
ncbi:MAG: hypothetical protein KDI34_15935 [Halioglobus sp.]|nr:hypothetical protein [Halioglobus sp.]